MKAAAIPSVNCVVLLARSALIATFGLRANSTPAIIGAMIIAPPMTPTEALPDSEAGRAQLGALGRYRCIGHPWPESAAKRNAWFSLPSIFSDLRR